MISHTEGATVRIDDMIAYTEETQSYEDGTTVYIIAVIRKYLFKILQWLLLFAFSLGSLHLRYFQI